VFREGARGFLPLRDVGREDARTGVRRGRRHGWRLQPRQPQHHRRCTPSHRSLRLRVTFAPAACLCESAPGLDQSRWIGTRRSLKATLIAPMGARPRARNHRAGWQRPPLEAGEAAAQAAMFRHAQSPARRHACRCRKAHHTPHSSSATRARLGNSQQHARGHGHERLHRPRGSGER
jgi:hypothetical protein